jgi:hypothetical protein
MLKGDNDARTGHYQASLFRRLGLTEHLIEEDLAQSGFDALGYDNP